MTWLAIGLGGALGSMTRHGVNQLVLTRWAAAGYPLGTTLVNISGCLVIGLLAGLIATDRLTLPMTSREFVFVGLIGGYTTFSTFGLETFTLLRGGAMGLALVNVATQVVGGLAAVWAGYFIASR